MRRVVMAAMILSWGYYLAVVSVTWGGQALLLHNDVWEMFDLAPVAARPPGWVVLSGLAVAALMPGSLGAAYIAVWRILSAGPGQDFRRMGGRMRRLAWVLIGFWAGWNLMTGAILALLIHVHPGEDGTAFAWDPLDNDIVFPIVAMAFIAISREMERAWLAEDETRHFL